MHFDVHQLDQSLLVGAGITLLAIFAVRLTVRAGFPSLLVYLLIGIGLGEAGLGIGFENAELAHALGFAALLLILAEGGLSTNWKEIRPAMPIGIGLATVGVGVGIGVVAFGAHYVLGFSWELSVLLAAVTAPTDAAAVFSVLRNVPVPRKLTGALEAESGLNDAPTVILVTVVSAGNAMDHGVHGLVALILFELAVGTLVGIGMGIVGGWVIRRSALPSSGLYPLSVLALCVLAYAAAATIHTSGFAAVYTAALVLGNLDLPHRAATKSFVEGIGWLAQIGLFVMLGLLASPERFTFAVVMEALVAGFILTFLARPLSVFLSALVTGIRKLTWREQAFLSWGGLRGAVPIVLCTIPLAEGVSESGRLFDIVFVMTIIYTLITSPSMPYVSRKLGVAVPYEPRDLEVEAAPLERIAADLLQITITEQSRMHGVEVSELRLPRGASVALVVRDGQIIVPDLRTVLRRQDELLVVTPRKLRDRTEKRLQAVSLRGRLAAWTGE